MLKIAKEKNYIKTTRHSPTEYHYLVKNKINGDVLLKPIFDIHTYISNPSNDLQINWSDEFKNENYFTPEDKYIEKVETLLNTIKKSVKDMITNTELFANCNIHDILFTKKEE
jgi:hypothetical protein